MEAVAVTCSPSCGWSPCKMQLLLALAGVLATFILIQPCEGTIPGNSTWTAKEEGRSKGRAIGGEDLGLGGGSLDAESPSL